MQFEITLTKTCKFFVPDNATDEEYDAMKEIVIAGMATNKVTPDTIKVKRIDVTEPKQPYEVNKECD